MTDATAVLNDQIAGEINHARFVYTGNLAHKAATLARTSATAVGLARLRNVVAMYSAINAISGSFMPCVVTDGVPIRTPLVTNGLRGSFGMLFLFNVIPASSRMSCYSLPVSSASNGRKSTTIMCVSVPPETKRNPCFDRASASAEAFFTICCA